METFVQGFSPPSLIWTRRKALGASVPISESEMELVAKQPVLALRQERRAYRESLFDKSTCFSVPSFPEPFQNPDQARPLKE